MVIDAGAVESALSAVAARLRERGEKMTTPRRAVVAALMEEGGHRQAEEIVEAVAQRAPSVHRASVYRALDALTAAGLVQHVHLGHGATAYHLVDGEGTHPHIQCHNCGRVADLSPRALDSVARRTRKDTGFTLDVGHVALSGTCPNCK